MGKALGFLGHLNDIGLKIQNVGHGCHLLSHTSLTRHRGMLSSATRFSNQLERHSSNQRQGGWRTATPIANHPPHTGNQSTGSSTPRPSEPSDTTTRPHQLGPSLPQVMTYLTTTRSSRSSCTSRHRRRTNPSSCRTTWFPGSPRRHRSEG